MNKYLDVFYSGKLILKKWYITLMIPSVIACLVGWFYYQNQNNNATYTAEASFILSPDRTKHGTLGDKMARQKFSLETVGTIVSLMKNNDVLSKTLKSVDGEKAYSDSQMQYSAVPGLQGSMNIRMDGTVAYLSVTNKSAARAQKLANNLIKTTQKVEKEVIGTNSLTVLNKAAYPVTPNSNNRKIFLMVAVSFLISFALLSFVMMVLNLKRLPR